MLRWLWPWKRRKTVFLVDCQGKMHVQGVIRTQSGNVANHHGQYPYILNSDGSVIVSGVIVRWLPRSGWEPGEHPVLKSQLEL